MRLKTLIQLLVTGVIIFSMPPLLTAGLGDIVVKSDQSTINTNEVKSVVFPHWIHRVQYKCKLCHENIFEIEAGKNPTNMKKIVQGESCGVCHNGKISWNIENCERCHSKNPEGWNSSMDRRWKSIQERTLNSLRSMMR